MMLKNERLLTKKITVKLSTINMSIDYLVLSGRVKNFPIGFTSQSSVPVLPYSKLARLVVLYHHNRHHRDVDTTVTVVRSDVWPIKVRKLVTSIDSMKVWIVVFTCLSTRAVHIDIATDYSTETW